jgi:23S rRNA-/tRNA-specific pseudouridylate synthase
MDVALVFRDPSFVVVDKPSGVVVHRGLANDAEDLLRAVRDAVGAWVYPVHRLDRGTSGAIVMALHPEAARSFGKAFEESRVEKRYIALTRGHPEDGDIDHPIANDEDGPRVPAVTRIRCLGTAGRYALVEAIPRTGRMHQIRKHLKHVACPIIGDVKYGKGEHNRYIMAFIGWRSTPRSSPSIIRTRASGCGSRFHRRASFARASSLSGWERTSRRRRRTILELPCPAVAIAGK